MQWWNCNHLPRCSFKAIICCTCNFHYTIREDISFNNTADLIWFCNFNGFVPVDSKEKADAAQRDILAKYISCCTLIRCAVYRLLQLRSPFSIKCFGTLDCNNMERKAEYTSVLVVFSEYTHKNKKGIYKRENFHSMALQDFLILNERGSQLISLEGFISISLESRICICLPRTLMYCGSNYKVANHTKKHNASNQVQNHSLCICDRILPGKALCGKHF